MNGTEIVGLLLGSVALLLWGVRMVRTGMTRSFGVALRRTLGTYIGTRASAFGVGLGRRAGEITEIHAAHRKSVFAIVAM